MKETFDIIQCKSCQIKEDAFDKHLIISYPIMLGKARMELREVQTARVKEKA